MNHPTLEARLAQYARDNYPCEIEPRVELKANPHLFQEPSHALNLDDPFDHEYEVYHNHRNDFVKWYDRMECHNPSCTYDAVATVWYTNRYACLLGITKCGQFCLWSD